MKSLKMSAGWSVLALAAVLSALWMWRASEHETRVTGDTADVGSGSGSGLGGELDLEAERAGREVSVPPPLPVKEPVKEPSPVVPSAAGPWTSSTLVRLTVSRDFRAVAAALKDPPPYGQDSERDGAWIEALRALSAESGDELESARADAVLHLRRLLADERRGERAPSEQAGFLVHLAEALADSEDEGVVADLLGLLDDRNQPVVVRSAAAVALMRFQVPAVKPALERYRADLRESVLEVSAEGGSVFELNEFLAEAEALLEQADARKKSP